MSSGMDTEQRIAARIKQGLLGRWYVIAKSGDVHPGKPCRVRALSRELVLWRGADGHVRCVEDRCPHRGARLSRGAIVGDDISCRYHGVTVNGDGKVVDVPAITNCPLQGRKAVTSYAVRELSDGIFAYFPSAQHPEPRELDLPHELASDEYATFLCSAPWSCNYHYVLDNLVDPMHGIYLHADTFTLGEGIRQDTVRLQETPQGFIANRVGQQGVNLDWVEAVVHGSMIYNRVIIPYPPAGGPGGPMIVIPCVTPVDESTCRLFFWRTRKVSDLEREVWRFVFRALFESRHWYVLEQDRDILVSLPDDARAHEHLYQHDVGVARIRRLIEKHAKDQIEIEDQGAALATSSIARR